MSIATKTPVCTTQKAQKRPDDIQAFLRFVGQNIKTFRMRLGLTQDQLAKKAGLARVSLARIETATTNVTLKHLFRLATAMNVTPDVFLNAADTIHISKQEVVQEGLQRLMKRILND